ncbi:hypothetical protein R5W23_004485 [Gemmata sp. JC673]|uniref:DUF6677 domain-containing protein n=1 Tax=Gemmata algarum TaxID=2975278 RepID=A0ABU5F625_9BACT|nr:DUF6677 family protein [Gemmata algarum]MDY3563002.1 hypothetical protein [Gemmata algarum]
MASSPTNDPPLPPIKLDVLAAGLSYLVPGLGQIYQGRVGKGLLFFGGLYLLFFYGMWMGNWRNVWLPDTEDLPDVQFLGANMPGPAKAISHRWQFLGQVWIGAAAWPGVYQYAVFDKTKDVGPVFGKFQRMPDERELNDLQRNGNKRWDLGWVYTVIAGVLNLLVIYDAFAGPMFREPPPDWVAHGSETAAATAAPPVVPPAPPVVSPAPIAAAANEGGTP